MGMEDALMNLIDEDEATLELIDRRHIVQFGIIERLLERIADLVTVVYCGEDLGTQKGPMVSYELYKKLFRPRHKKFIDLAKSYNKPIMMHTCGSSSWVYNDFIEMGVTAVEALQPEAVNMSPAYLKEKFGGRLVFHGCISTAGPLAFGTPGETRETVVSTLETMMPGGGYILAPTHMIQDNTPVENIIEMYKTAKEYGSYSMTG